MIKIIIKIISFIAMFTLITAVLNIIFTTIFYYFNQSLFFTFLPYRWFICSVTVFLLLAKGNIEINNFKI